MPPRKTRGKKRKTKGKKRRSGTKGKKYPKTFKRLMEKMYRGTKKRGSAAARYAYKNPEKIAGAGAGAAGLGLAGYEGYLAARRGLDSYSDLPGPDRFASPTAAAFRRGRKGVKDTYDYFTNPNRNIRADIAGGAYSAAEGADAFVRSIPRRGSGLLNRMFPRRNEDNMQTFLGTSSKKLKKEKINAERNKANFPGIASLGYGKRRRRRRRKSRCGSFGKKAKKPSAALKRMCKKHKVRLTLKRGGKRVYKSEAMLKKQCKKAMKRKKKK